MAYHEIIILPATGHFGRGSYDPGPNYGTFFEIDIARDLIQVLGEELDNDRINCRVIPLWEAPGMSRSDIASLTSENAISLHVAFGRGASQEDGRNATRSYFSDPGAAWLAKLLGESSYEWGKCSSFHHVMRPPKLQQDFFPNHSVLLEPFNLGIGDSTPYLARITTLAKSLAQTIRDYFERSQQAVRAKAFTPMTPEKRVADKSLVSDFLRAIDVGQLQSFVVDEDGDEENSAKKTHKTKQQKSSKAKAISHQQAAPKTKGDNDHLSSRDTGGLTDQTAG